MKKKNQAFTLMELVVYIGIASLIVLVLSGIIVQVSRVYARSKIYRAISENGNNALQKMSREIMAADSINLTESDFMTEPNTLALNQTGNDFKQFWAENNQNGVSTLYYSGEDTSPPNNPLALTSDGINVTELSFFYSPASGDKPASIRVILALGDSTEKYNINETFSTTANLRIY